MKNDLNASFNVEDWGGYAVCYDSLNKLNPYRNLQQRVLKELGSIKGQRIFNAGCGTGNFEKLVLEKCCEERFKMWSADFSFAMLETAQGKCHEDNGGKVCFIQADISRPLSFRSGFFDKIVSINSFYAVNNPLETLEEFCRVLKLGGRLIIATPKKGYQNGLILKEHCQSQKPDEYWLDAHQSPEREWHLIKEAISNAKLANQLIAIAQYNRKIQIAAKFHFFEEKEFDKLAIDCGLNVIKKDLVYANQCFLVVAEKQGGKNEKD